MTTNTAITKIDFLGYRYVCFALSLILFASFIGGAFYKYKTRGSVFLYSVDFTGGTQILFDFSKPVSSEKVMEILEQNSISGSTAREFSDHEVLIRLKPMEEESGENEAVLSMKNLADNIRTLLKNNLKDTDVKVLQTDSVGAGIGAELRQNSFLAIIIALIGMLAYIWLRFRSVSYGFGSIAALTHDVVVILSFILWFDYEISMNVISAILFILGYSINDTIVIFARIREVVAKKTNASMVSLVNNSINETLRRTILTSFATLLVVLALLIFGGEILRLLSISLVIGIVFGTYSSIYVASPVMLLLHKESK